MSRLDYSKWDNIELSDDEDIECHPNIDKKSFIRMRQRKIHEERAERRHGIEQYKKQLDWLESYMKCLNEIKAVPSEETKSQLNKLMKEFEGIPDELRWDKVSASSPSDWDAFKARIEAHRQVVVNERNRLMEEENKKISVDKLCKPGFDSSTRINPSKPKNSTSVSSASPSSSSQKEEIEVLNPAGVESAKRQRMKEDVLAKKGEEDVYINSADALVFANMDCKDYPAMYSFLRDSQHLVSQEIADEILASAFQLQMNGKVKKAYQYVHQALVLQFCSNLGKDGAMMFFSKIHDKNHKASIMFKEDLERTYKHIQTRTRALAEKAKGKRSGVNLEPVGNKMELFRELHPDLQQALLTEDLEKVHEVLDGMPERDRLKSLQACYDAGILEDQSNSLSNEEKLNLFKQLPEDFGQALVSGELERANELLSTYSQEEVERLLDICKRGGFLDVQEEDVEEDEHIGASTVVEKASMNAELDHATEIPNLSV